MDMTGFDITDQTIADVLSRNYEVPHLQRPYCWAREQTDTLFRDIHDEFRLALNMGDGEIPASQGYFLQQVVVHKRGASVRDGLPDGQQRLITLTALLDILRKRMPPEAGEAKAFIDDLISKSTGLEFELRIKPSDKKLEAALKEKFLGAEWPFVGRKPKPVNAFLTNYKRLETLVTTHLTPEECEQFALYIANHVKVNVQKISDFATAVMIFERQDRGRTLETADLVKAKLFRNFRGEVEYQSITENWDRFEEVLPEELRRRFVFHFATAYYSDEPVVPHGGARWWDDFFRGSGRSRGAEIASQLPRAASRYKFLLEGTDPLGDPSCTVHLKNLMGFVDNQAGNHMPYLLAVSEIDDPSARREFFYLGEAVLVIGRIAEMRSAPLARAQEHLAASAILVRNNELDKLRRELYMWIAEHAPTFRSKLMELTLNVQTNKAHRRIAQYLLGTVEARLRQLISQSSYPQSAFSFWDGADVEHVLPLTPPPGTVNSLSHELVVPRLGNMVILDKALNQSAGRLDIGAKLKVFGNADYKLTRALDKSLEFGERSQVGQFMADHGMPAPAGGDWAKAQVDAWQSFFTSVICDYLPIRQASAYFATASC